MPLIILYVRGVLASSLFYRRSLNQRYYLCLTLLFFSLFYIPMGVRFIYDFFNNKFLIKPIAVLYLIKF